MKKNIITAKSEKFLIEYLTNHSPTGFESSGQKLWLNYVKPYVDTHIVDTYGTVVGVINPDSKYKVVIEAHADEISWFVHYITKDGFIYLRRNGGSDHQIAPSKRVNIHTRNGMVKAVFGWPAIHTRTASNEKSPKLDNIFLDCGAKNKEEVENLGVHVGCVVTYEDDFMIMNKKHLFWIIPTILVLIFISSIYGFNNNAVTKLEQVKTSLSNVESSYQRRSDVISGLVNTVKGVADFEQEVLTEVVQARASAGQTTIDLSNLNSSNINEFTQAQQALSGALSRLLVTVERYPELKATQNFLEFQSQLEGTENRINVERNRYNEAVNTYNTHIKIFPNTIYARWLGFGEEFERFTSSEGSQNAPEIDFD